MRFFHFIPLILILFSSFGYIGQHTETTHPILDTCFRNRFDPQVRSNPIYTLPFHIAVGFLALFLIHLAFFFPRLRSTATPSRKRKRKSLWARICAFSQKIGWNYHRLALMCSFSLILWNLGTHILVVMLKHLLDDMHCNVKPNGVSGHTSMFTFMVLSLGYSMFLLFQNPSLKLKAHRIPAWGKPLILSEFGVYCVLACISLATTYFGGYHTLRQMWYGHLVGIFSHLLYVQLVVDPWLKPAIIQPAPKNATQASVSDQDWRPLFALTFGFVWVTLLFVGLSATELIRNHFDLPPSSMNVALPKSPMESFWSLPVNDQVFLCVTGVGYVVALCKLLVKPFLVWLV